MAATPSPGALTPPANPPAGEPIPIAAFASALFKALNADHAGNVTLADFDTALHLTAGHEPAKLLALFDHLDANNDHAVSLAEVGRALSTADANGDHRLSLAELTHNPITLIGMNLLHHDHLA